MKVGAFIRKWVEAYTGSDTIKLDRNMNLWAIVKQHLDIRPDDGSEISDRSEYIAIELLDTTGAKYYNMAAGKEMYMNTLYRCYITSRGQEIIQRYLR